MEEVKENVREVKEKAIEGLKKEHRVIRLALALFDIVKNKVKNGEKTFLKNIEDLISFFSVFLDKCHHGKEENFLFPELEKRGIPKENGPIGVMLGEHEIGRKYLEKIKEMLNRNRLDELHKLIEKYVSLIEEHINKENNVLFAIADTYLSEEEQKEIFERFEEFEIKEIGKGKHEEFHNMIRKMKEELFGESKVLDVREIPPSQRHSLIFSEFDNLSTSKSFIIINDHDPKPLYYQFQAEKQKKFSWEYLNTGPTMWIVRITKT